MDRLYRILKYFSKILAMVGAICLFLMCFITFIDLNIRKLPFHQFLGGVVELSELLTVTLVFSSLAFTFYEKQHVEVTSFVELLPNFYRKILMRIQLFLSVVLWSVVSYEMVLKAVSSVQMWEVRFGATIIPIWPFRIISAIGASFLCFALIITFLQNIKARPLHKTTIAI